MFKSKKIDNKLVFYSDIIPELEHFFTTRESVIHSNEKNVDIESNIHSIIRYLNLKKEDLISPVQTHSSNVQIVDSREDYPDTDSLILNDFKHAIYLNFADCVPVILYDKEKNIGAIAHAGWRGTAASICIKTVQVMVDKFSSSKNNIYAVIGPAISKCCFNVGIEVVEAINSTVINTDNLLIKQDGLYYVDLKLANFRQLQEFGIPTLNIDVSPHCTVCNNNLFFSYRKENATTSRHSAVIKLKF